MSITTTYAKTADPNIIMQTDVITSEMQLDRLQQKVDKLRDTVAALPAVKTKPDQETLEYWNSSISQFVVPEQTLLNDLEATIAEMSKL